MIKHQIRYLNIFISISIKKIESNIQSTTYNLDIRPIEGSFSSIDVFALSFHHGRTSVQPEMLTGQVVRIFRFNSTRESQLIKSLFRFYE